MVERTPEPRGRTDRDGLTIRDRRLLSGVLSGKTVTAAGREVGFPSNAAASQRWQAPALRAAFVRCLAEIGLDEPGLAAKAKELLESMSHSMTKDGMVVELGPDNNARAKVFDSVLKAVGAYPDPRQDINVNTGTIVVLQPEDQLAAGDLFGDVIDVTPTVKTD